MAGQENLSDDLNILLQRVSQGDERAFSDFVVRTSGMVHTYILRHVESRELAEEIVQDIFTQIWLARESLPGIRNPHTYLYVLVRNRALNELKKMIRLRRRKQAWEQSQVSGAGETAASDLEVRMTLVEQAIDQLPQQQRTAWLLSRKNGLTYKQVAAQMNISRETVKTYLQHAHASIARFLSGHPDMLLLICLALFSQ